MREEIINLNFQICIILAENRPNNATINLHR